jgi:hypothetical protein
MEYDEHPDAGFGECEGLDNKEGYDETRVCECDSA